MASGSVLRLPEDPKMARAKSISVKGDGPVAIKPGKISGGFQNVMLLEEMPQDFSRFRLNLSEGSYGGDFKPATSGKFLGVSSKR